MESVKKNSQFRIIYSQGSSYANKLLVLHFLENATDKTRFGITVSGKVGKAVLRNKIKRRIKAAIRLNSENIKPGYDIILVVRTNASESTYKEISEAVNHLLRKNDLLFNTSKDAWIY